MASTLVMVLLSCLALAPQPSWAVDLVFVDGVDHQYLVQGALQEHAMDSQGLATSLHSLLSTAPSFAVSRKTSQQA
jgi:hypothetical protein